MVISRLLIERHALEAGGVRFLGDNDSAFALDQAKALNAVCAGSGQHHTDGAFALILSKRSKENIDRMPEARGLLGLRGRSTTFSMVSSWSGAIT
jgi:hypothetical protein